MNVFNKTKEISSQLCVSIKYEINASGKTLKQVLFITEHYVYIESGSNKMLYLPEKDKQYFVDIENEQLKEHDMSNQIIQMKQVKALIGEISIEKIGDETSDMLDIRQVKLSNKPENPANFEAVLHIIIYEKLESTIFRKFNEFQNRLQIKNIRFLSWKTNRFVIDRSFKLFNINTKTNNHEKKQIKLFACNIIYYYRIKKSGASTGKSKSEFIALGNIRE